LYRNLNCLKFCYSEQKISNQYSA